MSLSAAPVPSVEVAPLPPEGDADASANDLVQQASTLRLATFRLSRRLRGQHAIDSMSDGQFAVLAALRSHGTHTLSELADRERVTSPSMNRTVNCLADGGFVERVADETDRRKVNILLTQPGDAVVAETVRRRNAWLTQVLSELSAEERSTLAAAAQIMRGIAER